MVGEESSLPLKGVVDFEIEHLPGKKDQAMLTGSNGPDCSKMGLAAAFFPTVKRRVTRLESRRQDTLLVHWISKVQEKFP
jgi:hypothetical protein